MNTSKLSKIGLAVLASSIMVTPAHSAALEEVVVTAQKREQSLQDVGLTVSAFGGDRLREAGVSDVVDIAGLTSNVQVNYGTGNSFFNVRGLGLNEFVSNLDAPVAVHVDEVYQSKGFMIGLAMFDIERVEVLKGPQGDLFGRNTTGGAVNFITARPEAETGGYFKLSYDNYSTINVEGAVTGGITDNLSGRLSGYRIDQRDGYFQNTTLNDDEGRLDELGLRGQLLWELDNTEVLASVHYGRDKSELHPYEGVGINEEGSTVADRKFCPEFLNGTVTGTTPNCFRGLDIFFNPNADFNNPAPNLQPGENDPYVVQNNFPFEADSEGVGGLLKIEHEFGDLTFTSITGYEDFEKNQTEDSDGSPVDSVQIYWYTEIEQLTQEFRLSSETDKSSWIAGLYYEKDELYNSDWLTAYEAVVGDAVGIWSTYDQDVEAMALFGHYEYQINDNFRLITGARYSEEETEAVGGTFRGLGVATFGNEERPAVVTSQITDLAVVPGGNKREDTDFSYKLGLNWTPSDNTLIYGSYTTGFRSGGYSVAFADVQESVVNLEPEEISAFEVGFKSTLLDNTLQINGAVYYYDVDDAHVDVDASSGPIPITVNAGAVEFSGAELDLQWAATDNLNIIAAVGWSDSEIQSDQLVESALGSVPIDGNRTAFNPEWTFNGQVRYEQPVSANYDMVLSTDFSWRDDTFLESNNQPANLRDAYWLVNARAAIKSNDGTWEAALWGKNLTDEAYQVYLNDLPAFGWLLNSYAAPRTYGVSLNYNF